MVWKGYIGSSMQGPHLQSENAEFTFGRRHVSIVVGNAGSGKSNTAKVILEEIAKRNRVEGIIVFDPKGDYFPIIHPTLNKRQLKQWNDVCFTELMPLGFRDKVKMVIPQGTEHFYDPSMYDLVLGLPFAALRPQVWDDIWGLKGDEQQSAIFSGMFYDQLTMPQMLDKLEDYERNDKYASKSIKAVRTKLSIINTWKIFQGHNRLDDLIETGKITIVDLTFVDEKIRRGLVAFTLFEVLERRKQIARIDSHNRISSNKLRVKDPIPPVTIFLDEAHRYVSNSAGVKSIKVYVREGRSPGCSIVFLSQEPETFDTTVISQPTNVIVHKLTHRKAIRKILDIVPNLPRKLFEHEVRNLKPGQAFAYLNEEQTIKIQVRPSQSAHLSITEIGYGEEDVEDSGIEFLPPSKLISELNEKLIRENEELRKERDKYLKQRNELIERRKANET